MKIVTIGLAAIIGAYHFVNHPLASMAAMNRWWLSRVGAEKRTLDAPSGKLTYYVAGSGPALVLLHGTNHQAGGWAPVAGDLARDHRLLIPDLPGHGESDPRSGPLTYEMLISSVEALLNREAPGERVTLVGNSMGGWIALLYAREHPDRVARVVLENSSGLTFFDYKGPKLVPTNREEARQVWAATFGGTAPDYLLDDLVRTAPGSAMSRFNLADVMKYMLDGKLRDVPFPVVLIWGENDGLLPVSYGKRLAAEFPQARLITLPNCAHIPHVQCTAAFLASFRESIANAAR